MKIFLILLTIVGSILFLASNPEYQNYWKKEYKRLFDPQGAALDQAKEMFGGQ